ncbi:MAG: DinB family protein [Thermodesulfobacteriota bacterium]|nr:DinB family protein [Thermodesulfobacteriota bacterium]
MGAIDYFRSAVKNLHHNLTEAIEGLSDEELHFRPLDKGNHIAFIIWHYVRTEDTVLNFFLQKKPPVWNAEGWDKKFGMDPRIQGTGMTNEQAAGIRIHNLKEFSQYMENTFKTGEAYIDGLNDENLDQVHDMPVLGNRSLYETIGDTILQHGSNHLGEIWYLKGLQGLKGSPA